MYFPKNNINKKNILCHFDVSININKFTAPWRVTWSTIWPNFQLAEELDSWPNETIGQRDNLTKDKQSQLCCQSLFGAWFYFKKCGWIKKWDSYLAILGFGNNNKLGQYFVNLLSGNFCEWPSLVKLPKHKIAKSCASTNKLNWLMS